MKYILVVDDERVLGDTFVRVLRRGGYEVATASGGAEALLKMRERRPDVVLLDLLMPNVNGFEVLEQMRLHGLGDVRVVLMSGLQDPQLPGLHLRFLGKPFDNAELIAAIEEPDPE